MNTIVCHGLDGSNPLHFLAALGALRLVSLADPGARLSWSAAMPYPPSLLTALSSEGCHLAAIGGLGVRGVLGLARRRRRLLREAQESEKDPERAGAGKAERVRARERKARAAFCKRSLRRIDAALGERGEAAMAKHHPLFGLGQCIHDVPRHGFRELASGEATPRLWLDLLPCLACDRDRVYDRRKGESGLSRTRFSFSNGGSGKALLKDVRANLLRLRPAGPEEPDLLGFSLGDDEVTGLMWEPAERREYALRWLDPTVDKTRSVPIRNVLAFVGLSFFPVAPGASEDRTVGFEEDEKAFVWPVWRDPLSVSVVQSLLASELMASPGGATLSERGVVARFRVEVVSAEKRNFFSPPMLV